MSLLPFKSAMPGIGFPALPDAEVLPIMGMLYQLERNQWLDAETHRQQSFKQLHQFLCHAAENVQYFHVILGDLGFDPEVPLTEEFWSQIPLMTRHTVQNEPKERLISTGIPKEYQPFNKIRSSGSTGAPVEVYQPAYKKILFSAANMLEYIIHDTDFSRKMAGIRTYKGKGLDQDRREMKSWGVPLNNLFHTGPSAIIDAQQDVDILADWVIKQNPGYLQLFPSILKVLLPILKARDAKLSNLHYLRTLGEQLPTHIREEARDVLGVKIVDSYSSQELGYMAMQCPKHEHYHLFQDGCFTEILNDNNQPCAPGEIGRVVVTDLLNPSFPMLRYEIGDYAEMGAPCDCGRGWPVIKRIMGRVRNLVTMPDGTRLWPETANAQFITIAPITQFQIVQKTPTSLNINIVASRAVTHDEKAQIAALVHERLGHEFDTDVVQMDVIPRGENGKYEDFRSEVTPEMIAAAKGQSS